MSQKQKGFSLIELMISSLLGIIVIGGMYSLFNANSNTVRIQGSVGLAQEQANFALEVIAEDIRLSGWPGVFVGTSSSPFADVFNEGDDGPFADSVGADSMDTGTQYDELIVSRTGKSAGFDNTDPFVNAGGEVDCVGDTRDFGINADPLTHRYFVDEDTRELKCESLISGNQVVIISNVDAFQVLYGIDTEPGPCKTIDPDTPNDDVRAECMAPTMYVSGNQVQSTLQAAKTNFLNAGVRLGPTNGQSDLIYIKTIQLAILVGTDEGNIVNPETAESTRYHFLRRQIGHGLQGADYSDGRAHRFAIRTIALRQALRGP